MSSPIYIHPSALVAPSAQIGEGTKIWMNAQVREDAHIGRECIVGKDAYIDFQVTIGNRCKIQNGALIYYAADLADGVFIGPGAILTNDRVPRAVTPDGELAGAGDWHAGSTRIGCGASVGAGAILLTSLTIGEYAMIGAGAVVTRNVPPHTLVVGNPARPIGYVCRCGQRLVEDANVWKCERDELRYEALPEGGLVACRVTMEFRAENTARSNGAGQSDIRAQESGSTDSAPPPV